MSTVPGRESWRDAGLLHPSDLDDLAEDVGQDVDPGGSEDYRPAAPRPDLDGAADPADVADQGFEVPDDDEDRAGSS
ncbi:MAG: hypothetical protein JJE50_03410 [Actinomycetales bacterium]|nr:hypothetical protein [Actinomycetales bacterium]